MIHSQVIIPLILLAVFFLPKWITDLVKLVQNARLEHPNKPFDLLFCLKVDHNVRVDHSVSGSQLVKAGQNM